MRRVLAGLAVAALLLSGCATPQDELRDEVVRTRAAAERAAQSGNPQVLREQVSALVALIARQRAAGDLTADQATRLTQLAQRLADDAQVLAAPAAPTATPTPTATEAPEPPSPSPSPTPSPEPEPVPVPDLTGKTGEEATAALAERELRGVGAGCADDDALVTAQEPPAGTEVPPRSTVSFACEVEDDTETVKVPDVTGRSYAEAVERLQKAELVGTDDGTCVDPALVVVAQDPPQGAEVAAGTEVLLGCAPA